MATTGREIDRLVICLVIVCVVAVGYYAFRNDSMARSKLKKQESQLTDRIKKLTNIVNQTRNSLDDWITKGDQAQEEKRQAASSDAATSDANATKEPDHGTSFATDGRSDGVGTPAPVAASTFRF